MLLKVLLKCFLVDQVELTGSGVQVTPPALQLCIGVKPGNLSGVPSC